MTIKTNEEALEALEEFFTLLHMNPEGVNVRDVYHAVKARGYQRAQLLSVCLATVAMIQSGHSDMEAAIKLALDSINERAQAMGAPPIPYYPDQ